MAPEPEALAAALGFAATRGIDWLELVLQVVLAALGVVIAARIFAARRGSRT